ncbi:ATP-binding protein [Salmonella enterica]|uniref:ATP-binding protein n=1 Tax=Salmonella enterica TaxID=28901 RepID=UPI0034DB7B08
MDPGILHKNKEPHFTTKEGRVRFGQRMGMSIVRSIIADHGGTLTIDSHPGSTIMRISLPAQSHEEES